MPDPIVDLLLDMMPAEITVQHVTKDRFGKETLTGSSFKVRGRLREGNMITRDRNGQEVTSTMQFTAAGVFGMMIDDRFTMPIGTTPKSPQAINVMTIPDENGPHHEKVMF